MTESDRTRKLFRALVKLPRQLSENPSAKVVHELRTTVRRVETLLDLVVAEPGGHEAKLLKKLGKLRKRAGKVRDLDVQMVALRGVKLDAGARDKTRVMRELHSRHSRQQGKLLRQVEDAMDSGLRKHLRQVSDAVLTLPPRRLAGGGAVLRALDSFATMAEAHRPLSAENLHEFRLQCKRLRYTAEMAPDDPKSVPVIRELRRIQDSAGQWHDCVTLAQTAEEVLGKPSNSPLLAALRATQRARLLEALRTSADAERALLALRREVLTRKPAASAEKAAAAQAS